MASWRAASLFACGSRLLFFVPVALKLSRNDESTMPRSTSQLDVDWLLGAPAPSGLTRLRTALTGLLAIGGLTGAVVAGWPWLSQRWLHRELVDGWRAAVMTDDSQRALDLVEPLGRLLPESLPQLAAALGHPDESVRMAAYRHLELFIDRSQVDSGGQRSLRRLVDHLGGVQPDLPVTGQLLLTGLLSRALAVLVTQPAIDAGELGIACQNLMDAAHGRIRATRRVMYQVDQLAAALAPPLAPLPGLAPYGGDHSASGRLGGGAPRVAVSDPPEPGAVAAGGRGGEFAIDTALPSSLRPSPRSSSSTSRLGGAGQVATISLKAGTGAKLINTPDSVGEAGSESQVMQPLDLALEDRDRLSGDLQPLAAVPVRTQRPAAPDEWPEEGPQAVDPPPSMPLEARAVRMQPSGERGVQPPAQAGGWTLPTEGLELLSESDLVRLLGSVRPALVSAAQLQLRERGWSDRLVHIAGTLAGGETEAKLLALDQLLSEPGVKATPWLMWMAEDGEPRVRRAAVERLASSGDPEVLRRVRLLLGRETDAAVRGAMQRVLISGGANPQEIR